MPCQLQMPTHTRVLSKVDTDCSEHSIRVTNTLKVAQQLAFHVRVTEARLQVLPQHDATLSIISGSCKRQERILQLSTGSPN
jgi:hypothetical protein